MSKRRSNARRKINAAASVHPHARNAVRRRIDSRQAGLVTCTPGVCDGHPVFDGTDIRVDHVITMLRSGASTSEIINRHRVLTPDDVTTARRFL